MTHLLKVVDEVLQESCLLFFCQATVYFSGLTKVIRLLDFETTMFIIKQRLIFFRILGCFFWFFLITVRFVVDRTRLLTDRHCTVTLVVVHLCKRTVDWKLLIIRANTVALCVRVREQATL